MEHYDIQAVMIFIFDDNRNLLLLKRGDNNGWEPVKGGMNDGESWEEAALREMREETELVPKNSLVLIDIIDDEVDTMIAKKTKIKGHVTFCFVLGDKPSPSFASDIEEEHYEYKWIKYDDIVKENIWPPIAGSMVVKVMERIEKDYN